jgi:hypothetical protein
MPAMRRALWRASHSAFCMASFDPLLIAKKVQLMRILAWVSQAFGLLICAALLAMPAVSGAADTSTPVTCKDGSTSPHGGRGACSGHGGIDKAATKAASQGTAPGNASSNGSSTAGSASSGSSTGAAAAPVPGSSASTHPPSTQTHGPSAAAAPGAGPDKVWVNTASKVYHCPADRWYGKTKQGEYMTEADAKAKGNRPDHNKPCS